MMLRESCYISWPDSRPAQQVGFRCKLSMIELERHTLDTLEKATDPLRLSSDSIPHGTHQPRRSKVESPQYTPQVESQRVYTVDLPICESVLTLRDLEA